MLGRFGRSFGRLPKNQNPEAREMVGVCFGVAKNGRLFDFFKTFKEVVQLHHFTQSIVQHPLCFGLFR